MELRNDRPMVSVIVPIYNVEPYLRECIDSVLNQTYQDFELILVDDGSPDGCPEICDEYAAADSRIHVIHKKNGGLSDARNAALNIAVGKYVFFLDSDDYLVPNMLETVVGHLEAGADMVVFRLVNVYPDGKTEIARDFEYGTYVMKTEAERKAFIHNTLLPSKIGWGAGSRIYTREKIEKYSLRFADNRRIFAEDLYFCLCYCAHAEKVVCIEDCLYYYRQREDSIMGVQTTRNNIDRLCVLCQEAHDFLRQFEDCRMLTDNFQLVFFQIIAGQFIYQLWASGVEPEKFRDSVIQSVSDWDFIRNQIQMQLNDPRALLAAYSGSVSAELQCHMRFLLGKSWLWLRVQCKLIRMFRPILDAWGAAKKKLLYQL